MATANTHKVAEIQQLLQTSYEIISLQAIGCLEEIPETADTLEGNALQKAWYVYDNYHQNCFSDDTGLEIEALNGRPGVFSARYAGEAKDAGANIRKVLAEMNGMTNRKACFRTVIAIILDGKAYCFEGRVDGTLLEEERGAGGFGYDAIFLPEGHSRSFAEMSLEEKSKLSHRGNAVQKLNAFLRERNSITGM